MVYVRSDAFLRASALVTLAGGAAAVALEAATGAISAASLLSGAVGGVFFVAIMAATTLSPSHVLKRAGRLTPGAGVEVVTPKPWTWRSLAKALMVTLVAIGVDRLSGSPGWLGAFFAATGAGMWAVAYRYSRVRSHVHKDLVFLPDSRPPRIRWFRRADQNFWIDEADVSR